jgi:PBP1b-binding outer membrane lipoprotein LpoB
LKKKIVVISFILITTLCGCSSPQVNKTDDITETKTYLYSYDYETETNGEVSTAYHEEKPSVDLNESHREVEPIVNFRSKAGLTFIKMNETYTSGTIYSFKSLFNSFKTICC